DLWPALAPPDVLLSSPAPVASLQGWVWSSGGHRGDYEAFMDGISRQFGTVEPMSCVFVIACLPRALLAAYATLDRAEPGYIEYRLPTLARAVGLNVVDHETFRAWRAADPASAQPTRRQRFLNGLRRPVRLPAIAIERVRRDGARIFHPYHGLYPFDTRWAVRAPVWAGTLTVRAVRERFAQVRAR
ncbi:MAG TPA: hypothetical protein VFR41_06585, partial [Acidimicrobiia bacterium]|nr:hypothetical protein [Acidimicrobiia bacterium]